MQNRKNRFRLSWILIFIAVVNSIFWVGFRWHYENQLRGAQLTADYDDISVLADAYNVPFPQLLQQLKDSGITSVGLYQLSLNNLSSNGRIDILSRATAEKIYPAASWSDYEASYQKLIVFPTQDTALANQVESHLQQQALEGFPPIRISLNTQNSQSQQGILIPFSKQLLNDANIGFDPLQVQQVKAAGLGITARISNSLNLNQDRLDMMLDEVQNVGAKVVIFAEDEVLGYSTMIGATAKAMQERGLLFGNIEFSKQRGWEAFSRLTGGQLVRVHSVGPDESAKMTPQALAERYSLAIKERDMRVAYIRLLRQEKGEIARSPQNPDELISKSSGLEQNLQFIRDIKQNVEQPFTLSFLRHGMQLGQAQAFGNYPMEQLVSFTGSQRSASILWYLGLFLTSLGVVGATLLILNLFFDLSAASERKWLIAGIGLAILMLFFDAATVHARSGAGGIFARIMGMWPQRMGIKLMATEVSCLVPVIAILWGGLGRVWRGFGENDSALAEVSLKSTFIEGIHILLRTSLILAIGALFVITLLNQWAFFSGTDKFFFYKITQLMPLVLVTIALMGSFFPHRVAENSAAQAKERAAAIWKRIVDSPITIKLAIITVVILVAGIIWMARSGNESGMTVSSLELHIRQFLGRVLITRPRTKEFLLGFPATIFAVWLIRKKWWPAAFLAVLVATIGQADMLDSFMHLHTPIFYAFMRSIYALIIGIVGGFIVTWICDRWAKRAS